MIKAPLDCDDFCDDLVVRMVESSQVPLEIPGKKGMSACFTRRTSQVRILYRPLRKSLRPKDLQREVTLKELKFKLCHWQSCQPYGIRNSLLANLLRRNLAAEQLALAPSCGIATIA